MTRLPYHIRYVRLIKLFAAHGTYSPVQIGDVLCIGITKLLYEDYSCETSAWILWYNSSVVGIVLNNFGPYDLDLKKGVDFGLKNSVYLDLNSFALSNFDLKPKLCQQCT